MPDTAALDTIFTHAGSLWDDQARLTLKGRRPYDPGTGRFLSEDPIGFADGPNPYRYAGNDPVNFRDPTGLSQAGNPLNNLFGLDDGWAPTPGYHPGNLAFDTHYLNGPSLDTAGLYSSNLPLFSDQLSANTQLSRMTSDLGRTYDVAQVNGRLVVFDPVSKIETGLQLQNIDAQGGGNYTAFVSPGENLMILENPSTGTQAAIAGVAFAGAGIVGTGIRGGWAAGATAFGREVVGETVQTGLETGISAATGINIPVPIGSPSRAGPGGAFTDSADFKYGWEWQSLVKEFGLRALELVRRLATGSRRLIPMRRHSGNGGGESVSIGKHAHFRSLVIWLQITSTETENLSSPHVGKFQGTRFHAWNTSLRTKLKLRTPFDDAHIGNIGANGIVFDPAVHPVMEYGAYGQSQLEAALGLATNFQETSKDSYAYF